MQHSLHIQTTVLPGHRIEVVAPGLPVGETASVHVMVDSSAPKQPLDAVLQNYPGGKLFRSAEEVDTYLHTEREAWDK